MKLSKREATTILAALRDWAVVYASKPNAAKLLFPQHFYTSSGGGKWTEPLSDDEIDALCARLILTQEGGETNEDSVS